MNRLWMLVMLMMVAMLGCGDNKKAAEDAATMEAQNAKVKAAIEKNKGMPKPNIGPPGMGGGAKKKADDGHGHEEGKEHAEGEHKEGEHAEGEHKEGEHAEGEHAEGDHKEGEHADESHEKNSSAKPDARKVLEQAIAQAKIDNKVVLVHYTAAW